MQKQLTLLPRVERFLSEPRKLFINGEWVEAVSGKHFETRNPVNGEVLTTVAEADQTDIDRAVQAARKAFDEGPWKTMAPRKRSALLRKLGQLIEEHAEELTQLEVLDNGMIYRFAERLVLNSAQRFYNAAGWATKIEGSTKKVTAPGNYFTYTVREPLGVCGQITPWNIPLSAAALKLAAPLASGNTVVLKPAEQTPLTALYLGELIQEAGFPNGVVNIVPGFGPTAGAALTEHKDVDKLSFTGSTAIGKQIMKSGAETVKPVSLELGGKSPNIIFADANLEKAIRGALMGYIPNSGQVCIAGSRLFVEKTVYDEVVHGLIEGSKQLTLGNGLNLETRMGPLVSEEQLKTVMGYIEKGKEEGAELLLGGTKADEPELANGYFVKPTIFGNVTDEMSIVKEEIFGPVICVLPFEDIDEVIQRANDTDYGLVAGVWTSDLAKVHRMTNELQAGTVWVNTFGNLDNEMPFGGYKQSGIGRENGRDVIDLYTQEKSVWISWD